MQTNYEGRVPREKADNVVPVIKEVFHLPDDTKPKWYLEGDIDLKEPAEYLLPGRSLFHTTIRRKGSNKSPTLVSRSKWSECYENWE